MVVCFDGDMQMRATVWLLIAQFLISGQEVALTLDQAVERAVSTYPAVRVSLEHVSAAAAGIDLARTSYLPRADFLGQANRATHNNVFGMLLPQAVIPSISGPVLGTNSFNNVWGTAVGGLVSWEPFDFGLRKANVDVARAVRDQANAQVSVTKLQVAAAAADTFLTILAAEDTLTTARAGAERARVVNQTVEALVKNELRPGADASRTRAELAFAETQVIQAQQALDVARAALAQLLGVASNALVVQAGPFRNLPPQQPTATAAVAQHPLAVAQQATVEEVRSRERALNRSYFPRFNLQGAAYARGTGAHPDGTTGGPASGLGPNIQNWGLGLTVTFPAFDLFSIRARQQIEQHNERAEDARYNQVLQDLNGGLEKANAILAGARRVAQNTPVQLEAARATEQQATARYKAGLANVIEVAEAERILTQAEIDDALAKLGVWRGLLGLAVAGGDVQPFLAISR